MAVAGIVAAWICSAIGGRLVKQPVLDPIVNDAEGVSRCALVVSLGVGADGEREIEVREVTDHRVVPISVAQVPASEYNMNINEANR